MKIMHKVFILALMPLFIGISSCSKEKQIERRLQKKDGVWNIETITYEEYEDNVLIETEIQNNAGTFTFDESTIVITFTEPNGSSDTFGGTWSNSDETVTIIVDGEALVMDVSDDSKKEITLTGEDIYSGGGTTYKDVYRYDLKRAN